MLRFRRKHKEIIVSSVATPVDKPVEHLSDRVYKQYLTIVVYVLAMLIIPWSEIQGFEFVDRVRYINYFLYKVNILEYSEFNNIIDYIKHEALWHFMVSTLVHKFGISIETVFILISAFCLTTTSFFLVRRSGCFSVALLFSPLLVTLAFSQLRMALAYSMLLLAYMLRKPLIAVVLILPALFIHTSMLLFIGIFLALKAFEYLNNKKGFSGFTVYLGCVLVGVAISIAIGPLRDVILGSVGDRRAAHDYITSSVLYMLYWVGLFGLTVLQRKSFYLKEVNQFSIIILSVVTANLFTGGYSLRFLSIGLPILMVTMLDMDKDKKKIALIFYTVYLLFQWVYWAKIRLIQ